MIKRITHNGVEVKDNFNYGSHPSHNGAALIELFHDPAKVNLIGF